MGKVTVCLFLVFSWVCLSVEYALKRPVPSTAKVEENNGIITIDATFKPTRAFNAQLNRKVDRKHAERICREALRRYFEVGQGSVTYSGLQSVGAPDYSKETAHYVFTVPQNTVKANPKTTGNIATVSSQQPTSPAVASSSQPKSKTNGMSVRNHTPITTSSTQLTKHEAVPRGPIQRRLITDGELKNLPIMGYFVRLKQDFQASFELKQEELLQCQSDADWEALISICALKKEVSALFDLDAIRAKYKFDAKLTGRELDDLLHFIENEKTQLETETLTFHKKLFYEIQNELNQNKVQLSAEIKTALPVDKTSIAEELKSVEELIRELDALKP